MIKGLFNKFKKKEQVIESDIKESSEIENLENENNDLSEEDAKLLEDERAEIIKEILEESVEEIVDEALEKQERIVHAQSIEGCEILDDKDDEKPEDVDVKVSLFDRLKEGLSKTKRGIVEKVDQILKSYSSIDEELFEDLEELLIMSDIGTTTTMKIIDELRDKIKVNKITDPENVRQQIKEIMVEILTDDKNELNVYDGPAIILVVGVNGVGKTTTIGKLSYKFKSEGKSVLLAAGDTFRAGAIDQLDIWAKRVGVDIVKHNEGADPGAVIFDAIASAKSKKHDVLICDTAGRLHNKKNLMNELAKIFKIVDKEYPGVSREVLLVVDATTGQNALSQVKVFKEVANITGIALTKLDGTAKGGIVLAVKSELDVPVKLIGVGEKMEDLQVFDAKNFVDALFG